MFSRFYPNGYVDSVFTIDYKKLYNKGYQAIIFDIDNTLAHHGEDPSTEVDALFKVIHTIGFKTLLFSDNSEERIKRFSKNIDSLFIAEVNKPNTAKLFKAIKALDLPKGKIIYIGDQIFRDIGMTNKVGIDSILVKYMRKAKQKKGIRRRLEKIVLWFYKNNKKYFNSIGDILVDKQSNHPRRKLFCEINPLFYKISTKKEQFKYEFQDLLNKEKITKHISPKKLKNVIAEHTSNIIKRAKGVDQETQQNKKLNTIIACQKINGIIIKPGETFSFWKTVGDTSKSKGFKVGRILRNNKLTTGIGGGLCNLANSIHYVVLHSPLDITEFHNHSDALAPDEGKRKPFSAGTAVSYNYIDYRFKNNTDKNIQLLAWIDDDLLHTELRSNSKFPYAYKLIEEDHHFAKEGNKYYRNSKIYVETTDKKTGEIINKKLVLDNHSEVMFDYDLIPKNQIRK
jgi:vancomycin resistance protein VanW